MSSRYLRPGALIGHVIVLAAALTCLRLGWWQWEVFEAVGGTGQNLGYSLLWPVFAGSFIYMWLRFLQLEANRDETETAGDDGTDTGAAAVSPEAPVAPQEDAAERGEGRGRGRRHTSSATTHETYTVGVGYIDDADDDPELAAYNRALAQLAEQDEIRGD